MKYESQIDAIRKQFEKELRKEEQLVRVAPFLPDYLDNFVVRMHSYNLYGRVGSITIDTKRYNYSSDKEKRQPDIKTMMQLLVDLPPEPATLVDDNNIVGVRPTATLDPKLIEKEKESKHVKLKNLFPVHFRCQVPHEGAVSEWRFEWYTYIDGELWEVNYSVLPRGVRNMGYFSVEYARYPNNGPITSVRSSHFTIDKKAELIRDENGVVARARVSYYNRGDRRVPSSPYIVWIPKVCGEMPDVVQALSFLSDKKCLSDKE